MSKTQSDIRHINAVDAGFVGEHIESFLKNLSGPAFFEIPGVDRTRRRAIVTLLHGNEPSGLKAIHHLIHEGFVPATDLGVIVAAVDAALHPPLLSHRYIPGEQDLNRCFTRVDDTHQTRLAGQIADLLNTYSPEAVIDTHNTSSHSEPFCVAVRQSQAILGLAGLFSDSLIIIDQKLGTLLEAVDNKIPTITVEFGAFMDPDADWLARETLHRFAATPNLNSLDSTMINVLEHALRLETEGHLKVTYASGIDASADLTMINSIDQFNFRKLPAGQTLGWFESREHRQLTARDVLGTDRYREYFDESGGQLTTRLPMTIFMATTDPVVANTDCLLYFTPN